MFIVYLAWVAPPEVTWFFAGFAGGVSLLFLWVAADSSSASRIETAALAEERTSQVVRKLRREGWSVIDNIPFDKYDVDHVAFGPGGVVLLETKWTSDGFTTKYGRLTGYGENALRQASRNTQKINTVLHRNGYSGDVTHAIVAVWGTTASSGPIFSGTGDAMLINGDELGDFLRALDTVLSPDEATRAYDAIDEFVELRVAYEKAAAQAR